LKIKLLFTRISENFQKKFRKESKTFKLELSGLISLTWCKLIFYLETWFGPNLFKMELAQSLKTRCSGEKHWGDEGYHPDQTHDCVYNLKWLDLIQQYPQHEGLLRDGWTLATCHPNYASEWRDLQEAYPDVPGLEDLKQKGSDHPQFSELMEQVRNREPAEHVRNWFRLDYYFSNSLTWTENSKVWELLECVGGGKYFRPGDPVTPDRLAQSCFGEHPPPEVVSAAQNPDVISFCEVLRYYH